MDSVRKSWGFRTSRDPFQENSSQGLEGNKGQKSTPSREVVCSGTSLEKEPTRVCPLEREKPLRRLAVFAGALTSLQFDPHRFLKRCQLRSRLIQCSSGTCLRRENVPLRLVFTFDLHVQEWDSCRKVVTLDWLAANDSEPSPQQRASVRAVRRFLGRKTAKPTATPWIYPRRSTSTGVSKASKCRPLATRFFDVLTAPVFQEKKS